MATAALPETEHARIRGVIAELSGKRRQVAALDQKLAQLDRERRFLRVTLESSFRGQTNPSTSKPYTQADAGDAAATHADYVAKLVIIEAVTYERTVLLAEAESRALQAQLEIASVRAIGEGL